MSSHRECVFKLVNKYRQEGKGWVSHTKKRGGELITCLRWLETCSHSTVLVSILFWWLVSPCPPLKKYNLFFILRPYSTLKNTHTHKKKKTSHQIQPSLISPYFGNPHATPCSLYCCNRVSDSTASSSSALLLCSSLMIVWSLFCRECGIKTGGWGGGVCCSVKALHHESPCKPHLATSWRLRRLSGSDC